MNLKQALKRKNKLTTIIQQEYMKMITYNSVDVENDKPYSSKLAMENWIGYINELIDLKTAIHRANNPIYDKIFRLSELKSLVKNLRQLNCVEGREKDRWSDATKPVIKKAEIFFHKSAVLFLQCVIKFTFCKNHAIQCCHYNYYPF